jgi:nitroreductase
MSDSIFFRRESKRAFLSRAVSEDKLQRIFEIVRWSPSCSNNQPWRFIFVTDREQHARFMEALPKGNQWAAAAPVLIAVCAREADDLSRKDDPVKYYQFDSGLATMSLLLAAVDEGLMAHPMAGYDAVKLHEALDIPAEYHVQCIVALGYPGPLEQLDERTRLKDESPRTRKELDEIIARNRFEFADA